MVDQCLPGKSLSEFYSIPRHGFGIDSPREISKQVLVKEKNGVSASHCPKAARACVLCQTHCQSGFR